MMRRISMTARDELVAAIAGRYAQGDRAERGRILDEFAAVTGFHRKHAMRLLRAGQVTRSCGPRPDRRVYDEAVREALIVVWEASDRICGKRLRPLLPILAAARAQAGGLRSSGGTGARSVQHQLRRAALCAFSPSQALSTGSPQFVHITCCCESGELDFLGRESGVEKA